MLKSALMFMPTSIPMRKCRGQSSCALTGTLIQTSRGGGTSNGGGCSAATRATTPKPQAKHRTTHTQPRMAKDAHREFLAWEGQRVRRLMEKLAGAPTT